MNSECYLPKAKQRNKMQENDEKKMSTELLCNIVYATECLTISSHMKKIFHVTEMYIYRQMIGIPWTHHVSNQDEHLYLESERDNSNL